MGTLSSSGRSLRTSKRRVGDHWLKNDSASWALSGRVKRKPWPLSHFLSRISERSCGRSIPSAVVSISSALPSWTKVWRRISPSPPSASWETKERSIFSTSTGNWRKWEREE